MAIKFNVGNSGNKRGKKKNSSPFSHDTRGVNLYFVAVQIIIFISIITAGFAYLLLFVEHDARHEERLKYQQLILIDIKTKVREALDDTQSVMKAFAQDPELVSAFADDEKLKLYQEKAQNYFPEALRVMLIKKGDEKPLLKMDPPLGYRVAEMMKKAAVDQAAPDMELLYPGGPKENMNYVQPILDKNSEGVAGYLLVTFKRRLMNGILMGQELSHGYAEIAYVGGQRAVVAKKGDESLLAGLDDLGKTSSRIQVFGKPFEVVYVIAEDPGLMGGVDMVMVAGIAVGFIILVSIAVVVSLNMVRRAALKDGATIINLIEDIKESRVKGNYSIEIHSLRESMIKMMDLGNEIVSAGMAQKFKAKHKAKTAATPVVEEEPTAEDIEAAQQELQAQADAAHTTFPPDASGIESEHIEDTEQYFQQPEDTALEIEAEASVAEEDENQFEVLEIAEEATEEQQKLEEHDAEATSEEQKEEKNDLDMGLDFVVDEKPALEEAIEDVQEVNPTIFRAYDIRGVVGESLSPTIAKLIGKAIGSEAADKGQTAVVVGRDGRLSGPMLMDALIEGLKSTGRMVINIGQVPTPVMYYATYSLGTGAGVALTGSHNPSNYNGFKVMLGGKTLSGAEIQGLLTRIQDEDFVEGDGHVREQNIESDYIERITGDVTLRRPLKVVIDCGNGVAGDIAPKLFRKLGCDIEPLFCEVDGNFPHHHPDPSEPENLDAMISLIKLQKADLGIAFDGDGDRLGVVDCQGNIIWPDRQMMLFSRDVLSRNPGADIIFDVKCTNHLARVISENAGVPVMWKTGHSLVKAKLQEVNSPLAGEMSGHIFFGERWYGFDDALYAGARLLEILAEDPRPTDEIFAELPDSVNTPEIKINLEEGQPNEFMKKFIAKARFDDAKISTIDGMRADFVDGWGLVRASNTTPCLVLRFDADNEGALEQIKERFREQMLSVDSEMVLPF